MDLSSMDICLRVWRGDLLDAVSVISMSLMGGQAGVQMRCRELGQLKGFVAGETTVWILFGMC